MLRQILAVAAGIVVFLALVAAFDGLASVLFPLPPSADPNDPDVFRDQMANAPIGALVIVLAGSTVAAFAGSYVTAILVGVGAWYWPYVTGAIGLAATLTNALTTPHPTWFVAAAPLGVIGASALGGWLAGRGRRGSAPRARAVPKPKPKPKPKQAGTRGGR